MKIARIFLAGLFSLLVCIVAVEAKACPSEVSDIQLEKYEIVFSGKAVVPKTNIFQEWLAAISNKDSAVTTFSVIRRIAGSSSRKVDISHSTKSSVEGGIRFRAGKDYYVFVSRNSAGTLVLDPCSPTILENSGVLDKKDISDLIGYIKTQQGYSTLLKKIEADLKVNYDKALKEVGELYNKYPNPDTAVSSKKKYNNKGVCDGVYAANQSTPYFLKGFPLPVPEGNYLINRQGILDYGITLFKMGRYKEALRPICLSDDKSPEVIFWKNLTLSKLGLYKKDLSKYIETAALTVRDVNLEGLDIGGFDFQKANIYDVSFRNGNLSGSNFKKARLENINAVNTVFVDTDFSGGSLKGDFTSVNFSGSTFQNVNFNASIFINADFSGANIKGANFSQVKLSNFKGVNLKDAIFDESTIWPTGFLPVKHGAVLVNSSNVQERLTVNKGVYIGEEKKPATLMLKDEGIYLVDGVHIKNFRRISVENGKVNKLKIFSSTLPGEALVKHSGKQGPYKKIFVFGDAKRDLVVLDGCFGWVLPENESLTSAFITPLGRDKGKAVQLQKYLASPHAGQQVEVLIQKNLNVSFSKDCFSPEVKEFIVMPAEGQSMKDGWIVPFSESKKSRISLLRDKALSLETYWAEKGPPNLINLPEPVAGTETCPAGRAIYKASGVYNLNVPKGCKTVYVKAWGGGGGGRKGGPSGFTTGVIELPEDAKLTAIVGGAGKHPVGHKYGRGGYNGGGDGGNGTTSHQAFRGGGGGGGRTELIVDGIPVLIAGGGGGSGRGPVAYAGGGRMADDLTHPYVQSKFSLSISPKQLSGSQGKGGKTMVTKSRRNSCQVPTNGSSKVGGNGGGAKNIDCGVAGGGGGGAGFGGGAGGTRDAPGGGGGGGGLAPEYGITVWGRMGGHLPANADDLYHADLAGRPGYDGLIAITWPAPDPEEFFKPIVAHVSDKTPFVKDDRSPHLKKIYKDMYEQQRKDYERSGVAKNIFRGKNPKAYLINDDLNISVYDEWVSEVHPKEQYFYELITDLMKSKKLPTEFLYSGEKYGMDGGDYVLKQLNKGFVAVDKDANGSNNIRRAKLGQYDRSRIFTAGWGKYYSDLICAADKKGLPIYALEHENIFGGIGIAIKIERGLLKIIKVLDGMPAMKAGLRAGDTIVAIDGAPARDSSIDKFIEALRGEVGTYVNIEYESLERSNELQKASLMRVYIKNELRKEPRILFKTDRKTQKTHQNYIIFGKDIFPSDMVWESNKKLKNTKTQDSIEFLSEPCANFVFLEDGEMQMPPTELVEKEEGKNLYEPNEIFETYSEIPKILINHYIRADANREIYLRNTVHGFIRLSGNTSYIDSDFVNEKMRDAVKEAIKRQRVQTLNYDDDLDGAVTFSEFENYFKTKYINLPLDRYKQSLEDTLKQFEKLDRNRDQTISNDEMVVLDKDVQVNVEGQVLNRYQPYLDTDPNNDKNLTKDELSELAEKAFNTIDLNRDGKLDVEEISKYKSGLASQIFSDKE